MQRVNCSVNAVFRNHSACCFETANELRRDVILNETSSLLDGAVRGPCALDDFTTKMAAFLDSYPSTDVPIYINIYENENRSMGLMTISKTAKNHPK